jgi:methylmalonyl-CoA mutase N-terminal domain/subunit
MSVRIQQILMHETNLAKVVDPLGGSFYLESLCVDLEERALEFLGEIENKGGFISTLDSGWLHGKASDNQYQLEQALLSGKREVVGVNVHMGEGDPFEVDGFQSSDDVFDRATKRLKDLRRTRDTSTAISALKELRSTCGNGGNLMGPMLKAVEADASLGEIGEVFREVYGDWKVPIIF